MEGKSYMGAPRGEELEEMNDIETGSCTGIDVGIVLRFSNISYRVATLQGAKTQILKNVSGVASPGRFLALMGASGEAEPRTCTTLSLHASHVYNKSLRPGFKGLLVFLPSSQRTLSPYKPLLVLGGVNIRATSVLGGLQWVRPVNSV